MKKLNISIIAIILSSLISSCSKSNVPPPAPLEKIAPNKVHVKVIWSRRTGNGTGGLGNYNLAPASNSTTVFVPNQNGKIFAINIANGKVIWKKNTKTNISSQPNIVSNALIFGTMKGDLIALDTTTGDTLWHANMPSSLLSKPTIFDDTVYTLSHDGTVSAFNVMNGKSIWGVTNSIPEITLVNNSSPVVLNNTVMIGTSYGTVLGFTASDGDRTINIPIAIAHGSSPAEKMVDITADAMLYRGYIIFASYQGAIVALDRDNGKMMWAKKSSIINNMSINNNVIFTTQADSSIKAFNIETGKTIWSQNILDWRKISGPIYYKGMIVVADYEGYLHFFNSLNGQYLGRYKLTPISNFFNYGVTQQLVATKKGILVESNKGKIFLVDAYGDKVIYDNILSDYIVDKGDKKIGHINKQIVIKPVIKKVVTKKEKSQEPDNKKPISTDKSNNKTKQSVAKDSSQTQNTDTVSLDNSKSRDMNV